MLEPEQQWICRRTAVDTQTQPPDETRRWLDHPCTLMSHRAPAPTQPHPLLYLSVRLGDKRCWALLDCGAADNFIAQETVKVAQLDAHPLEMPLAVSLGNGQLVYANQYVHADLRFEG